MTGVFQNFTYGLPDFHPPVIDGNMEDVFSLTTPSGKHLQTRHQAWKAALGVSSQKMFLQATNAESQAPEIGLRLRNQWQNGCRWDSRILTSKSSFLTYYNRKHAFLSRHLRRRGALERAQESSARWVIGTRLLIHLSHNHRWEALAEIYYIYLSQVCGTFLELTPQRMGQVTID